MHFSNKKLSFDIFTNIVMEHGSLLNILMIFDIKQKFWPIQCIAGYCYKYTCAPMTGFVLQGHIVVTQLRLKPFNKREMSVSGQ